jgi:predicted HicB family RNase H-like nuclease
MAASTTKRNPPRVPVFLRVPPSLRDRLVAAARDTGVSLNAYAEHALTVYLEFLRYEEGHHHE